MDDTTLTVDPGNAAQLRDWDGEHGAYWAARADHYDAGYARHMPRLLAVIAARAGERILDVGCGSGQLAVELVRGTPGTTAVGIDLSRAQLEVARRRAAGLPAAFLQADAQAHDLGEATYDAVVSRSGTMFFADPGRAFANLARATRPGGRLVMHVWRGIAENPWLAELLEAVGRVRPLPPPPADGPGPFALSDPDRVRALLEAAGWHDVSLEPLDQPIWFGRDADDATDFITGQLAFVLSRLDDSDRTAAVANLHDVMARNTSADGVTLAAGAWLVTALR